MLELDSIGHSADASFDNMDLARALYYEYLHECAILRARARSYRRAARRRRALRRLEADRLARRERCRARRQRALELVEDRRRVWRGQFIQRHRLLYPAQYPNQ